MAKSKYVAYSKVLASRTFIFDTCIVGRTRLGPAFMVMQGSTLVVGKSRYDPRLNLECDEHVFETKKVKVSCCGPGEESLHT